MDSFLSLSWIRAALLPLVVLISLAGCRSQPSATSAAGQAGSTPGSTPTPAAVLPGSERTGNVSAAANSQPATPLLIPVGTKLPVRINQTLTTKQNHAGDPFSAALDVPIAVGDKVALPKGTLFYGHVTNAAPSGRLKGRAALGLVLDSFELDGRRYAIETGARERVSGRHRKRNWTLIGGGAGLGAALGAIAGGGTGALIGAGAGSAAGTVGAALTGKKQVTVSSETPLTFLLRQGVSIPGSSVRP